MSTGQVVVLWAFLILAYWAPTITAIARKHRVAQVLVINLLLGWTTIGWVVALVFAVGPKVQPSRLAPVARGRLVVTDESVAGQYVVIDEPPPSFPSAPPAPPPPR